MSNEWRTLKDIWEEHGHGALVVNKLWGAEETPWRLVDVEDEGACLCGDFPGSYEEKVALSPEWRIYEEPKQPKKWAPALYKIDSRSNWILSCAWYSSFSEAASDNDQIFKLIWPAPGFTPVEIPE